jgi:thymidylate synthase (FAD)
VNIVKPYAKIIEPFDGIAALKHIEWCGRISHRSEDAQTDDSYIRFIQAVVLGHGDWSITEHASVSVDMLVDRGITHEIVRHRLFSFTQESTRFVNYEKKMPPQFILPDFGKTDWSVQAEREWRTGIEAAEHAYRHLLGNGVSPQIARSVFPNALASRIIITGNLRNWRHFFLMRTSKEAHPQMRDVTIPLLEQFQQRVPLLYDDIVPMQRQIDNMRLPR